MGLKVLHELLKEDQEPFQLKHFIADRRSQIKNTAAGAGNSALNVRKRKPIIESTSRSFCINKVCLFSFQDSPEFRKSPFLDFPMRELKSPCNNATVFLHIPARTAAMLLDAAARVQKPRPGSKQIGLGLLGSFLRRLKDRSTRTKSREIEPDNSTPSSPPTRRSRKKNVNDQLTRQNLSSGVRSEKLSELETSCSSRSVHEFEEIECFCSNSSSPFRFSLKRSSSPTRREPDLSSSVASPSRHFKQDIDCYEVERQENNRQKDKEKEHCSPVSVLDPLFDDGDEEEEREDGATEEDGYDIECSYANVQRVKHELLQKLQRFERLAGLDTIKLENHMLEQRYNEDEDILVDGEEATNEELFKEIVNHLCVGKIPWYMKKLIFDLIEEENKNEEHHMIVQRVCKRLHSWKAVELNTIDMMVETDLRSEGWKTCDKEMVREMGMDIDVAIFGFLVEELAQELVTYSSF
ncbi:hypothetical protein L1987_84379 [Smallanthus sonchifolius]|uniref:Uncharacterized protein n=1 Tax=Smallanthus sonchifolius TaxID=185202 RepID=A0ACB8YF61_9ASTR|nr:hypothetical protein L1987_84379 [Smallanthus sonchifolius]